MAESSTAAPPLLLTVAQAAARLNVGRTTLYGLIADHLASAGHRGGARHVGKVMSLEGAAVPWWRVVRADGSLPPHLVVDAQREWAREKTPVKRGRVDVAAALWTA